MVKSLLSNSALLKIRIPALLFNCSYASSEQKIGIYLQFVDSFQICRFHLQLRNSEQLATFACCGIRDTTNVSTKFMFQFFVRGVHGHFLNEIHLYFETCLKISCWGHTDIQTQNCAPIHCTVWPRNAGC